MAPLGYHSLNVKGAAHLTLGDTNEAERSFAASTFANGHHAETYNNWGILLQRRNQHESAISKFSFSLTLNPKFPQPLFNTGMSLYATKNIERAVGYFAAAVDLDGLYVRAYANWALALHAIGRGETATLALQEALRLEPQNGEVLAIVSQLKREL